MKLLINAIALITAAATLAACSQGTQSIPSPADPASAPDAGTLGAGGGGHR